MVCDCGFSVVFGGIPRLLCGVFICRGLGAGLAVLTAMSENIVVFREVLV